MPHFEKRYKGQFVKKSVFEKKQKVLESIERRKALRNIENDKNRPGVSSGNRVRIVDVDHLANQLSCNICKNDLSLKNIVNETLMGVHAIFHVRCQSCESINSVHSGGRHKLNESAQKFDKDKYHNDLTTMVVLGKWVYHICNKKAEPSPVNHLKFLIDQVQFMPE